MFKYFYFYLLLIITSSLAFAESASQSDEYFINFCEKNSSQEKFLANIGKEILSKEQKRVEFISGLTNKKYPACIEILTEYIKKIISEKEYKPKAGEQSILALALVAKIPEATKMIELEIDKGYLSSWIDVLKETNEQGYILSLKSWIKRVGKEIRERDNTKLLNVSEYGKAQVGKEIKYPDMVRIWTPILMGRYLTEMITRKEKLTVSEFNDLNIIFAASTTSYRETFLDQIIKIVEYNPKDWITSFRCEEPWVEFRLFPIMKILGKKDGYIKREIIWLAKYHQDPKLKSLANATLDSVVSEKIEKTEKTKTIHKK
ncbi:hypothetical protein [Pigmentibacter ruber]|uniref:hypothetical protein n=1 Tax=Pigmentibacter ruber TaxID=2683196 RepID=UPI00131AAFCF|nr:hypothetical protein [Pigmentibacter ruber]